MRTSSLAFVALISSAVLAVPPTPVSDSTGVTKNRYISMSVPSNGGQPTALRVKLTSLMHTVDPFHLDFTSFEGEYRWVGPPVFGTENDNNPTPFIAAPLQCMPYYHDWNTLGLFHVYGDAVVPGSLYDVEVLDGSCQGAEGSCSDISTALSIATRCSWGDTQDICMSTHSFSDVDFVQFQVSRLNFETKARLQLQPNVPDPLRTVNVNDVIRAQDAWGGGVARYPFAGPSSCGASRISMPSEGDPTQQPPSAVLDTPTLNVFLTPAPAQGTSTYPAGTTINGQEMYAPTGGFRAFFHVELEGWNPGGTSPILAGYQFQFQGADFLGLNANPPLPGIDLTPAAVPCSNPGASAFCHSTFGDARSTCTQGMCDPITVDSSRGDFIYLDTGSRFGKALDSLGGPLVFALQLDSMELPDDGARKYAGTLILDVPPEANGHIYTLGFRIENETIVTARRVSNQSILEDFPVHAFVPAILKIGVQSDATGINRCRFISFVPGHSGEQMAIRVKLVSLHHVNPPYSGGPSVPFTSFEGQYRWVGPPTQYVESTSTNVAFYASSLQCNPHYQDWNSAGYLHVTGSAIVPSSLYDVQFVPASCMGNENSCAEISAPLSLATTRWGDVETPFNPPSTNTQPDLGDVSALVNKFKNVEGAPIKARALLAGSDASGNIDLSNNISFAHISACVDAFKGAAYPHTGPEACP